MGNKYKEKENANLPATPHQDAAKDLKSIAPPPMDVQAGEPVQMSQGSPDEMMEKAAGVGISNQSLSFGVTMGANQTLVDQPPNTVHTGKKGVRANANIHENGFSVNFNPGMTITHDPGRWLPNVNIGLNRYSWNFDTQQLHANWKAPRIVNWLGDPGSQIHSAMQSQVINKLPNRMKTKGYNPFQDKNIVDDLQDLFQTVGSGPEGQLPQTSNASLGAGLTIDNELATDAGGYKVGIPAGTRMNLSVNAGGGIPEDLSQLSVDSIRLGFSGGSANVDFSILGEKVSALKIRSVTIRKGGELDFDYELITETLESLGRLLIMIGQLRTGQDMGVRSLESRHPGLRQKVDDTLQEKVGPMLKNFVLSNKNAVPGLDLAQVLGIK